MLAEYCRLCPMVSDDTLKQKLKIQLKNFHLNEDDENTLVREINYFSNLIIDIYLSKKNDNRKTNDSQ